MKSVFIALFVVCSCVATAQVLPDFSKKSIQMDEKSVSNKDWNAFLHFIQSDNGFSKEYVKSMLPDGWNLNMDSLKNKDKAVVGVSWNQAMEYCKWKSEVATYLHTHKKTASFSQMKTDNQLAKTVIVCRLPTEAEFEKLNTKIVKTNKTKTAQNGIGFRCVYDIRESA